MKILTIFINRDPKDMIPFRMLNLHFFISWHVRSRIRDAQYFGDYFRVHRI